MTDGIHDIVRWAVAPEKLYICSSRARHAHDNSIAGYTWLNSVLRVHRWSSHTPSAIYQGWWDLLYCKIFFNYSINQCTITTPYNNNQDIHIYNHITDNKSIWSSLRLAAFDLCFRTKSEQKKNDKQYIAKDRQYYHKPLCQPNPNELDLLILPTTVSARTDACQGWEDSKKAWSAESALECE